MENSGTVEAKATVELDGRELALLISASIKRSKAEERNGNRFLSQQFLLLADKLADVKEEFHKAHYGLYAKRYGLEKSEKPASEEQASQE